MKEIFTVVLPDIGEGVTEGEVVEWLKQPGDDLAQDEPVVLVMTDKATVELPAPYPGKLAKQYYALGEIAIKDQPLYEIELSEGVSVPQSVVKKEKALAAPPTRLFARELGVDLASVPATRPDSIVSKEDVARFHKNKKPSESGCALPPVSQSTPVTRFDDDEVQPILGVRSIIADRMAESRYLIPEFSYFTEMDASRLVQLRQNVKPMAAASGIRLTYMPLFIRALSVALQEFPSLNASLDMDSNSLVVHKQHNIGIAVKTRQGLIVPVLKGVQEMSLEGVIRSYDTLVQKARNYGLDPADMRDGTITISNYGAVGGGWATPIINYPEVCILGISHIEKRPVVRNDQIEVGEMLNLSWSCDHRVVDGDVAIEFSNHFISLLENPSRIL